MLYSYTYTVDKIANGYRYNIGGLDAKNLETPLLKITYKQPIQIYDRHKKGCLTLEWTAILNAYEMLVVKNYDAMTSILATYTNGLVALEWQTYAERYEEAKKIFATTH
mgnify:FL=1